MNFAPIQLDADDLDFWNECRNFFAEHVTTATLERERTTGGGFDEELHLAMGRRGWVAPRWPVDEGGAGLNDLQVRMVELERIRSRAPMVLASTTLLAPVAIRLFGESSLKAEVLRGVADGGIRICLGYTEPDCGSDLAAVRTRAMSDGDEWVISGQKMFTTGAQFCQYCFCLTRTDPDAKKHKGLTVFLVPLDLPGVEIRPIETMGGERTNFVHFEEVRVHDKFRVGPIGDGWSVIAAPLAEEHAMNSGDDDGSTHMYTAMAKRVLDASLNALEQCELADPLTRARLAGAALALAATSATPSVMRRILSADTLVSIASDLLELVGPAGLLQNGVQGSRADGDLEYGFRFAPGTTIYGGSTDIQRNLIAEHMLGLPRSTPKG